MKPFEQFIREHFENMLKLNEDTFFEKEQILTMSDAVWLVGQWLKLQQADGSGSLPTAEEITAFSWQWAEDDNGHGPDKYFADCNFKAGARWMLSKVVGNDR